MVAVKGQKRGVTAPIDWAACGTEANYKRHQRLGEQPCEKCRLAQNRIQQQRRRRRREHRQGDR